MDKIYYRGVKTVWSFFQFLEVPDSCLGYVNMINKMGWNAVVLSIASFQCQGISFGWANSSYYGTVASTVVGILRRPVSIGAHGVNAESL